MSSPPERSSTVAAARIRFIPRSTERSAALRSDRPTTRRCQSAPVSLSSCSGTESVMKAGLYFPDQYRSRIGAPAVSGPRSRGPRLAERGEALLEVAGARRQLERVGLGLHRGREAALEGAVDAPLREPERHGGRGGELGDQGVDRGVELVLGHRPVDQAPLGGGGARQLAAEQQQLLRPGDADQPGQQPRRAAVGAEAAPEERLPEATRVGGDGEVGGERELAPEAGGPALHATHHRQLQLDEQRDHAVRLHRRAALDAPGPWAGRVGRVRGDPVRARAEVVTRPRQDDDPQRVVDGGCLERAGPLGRWRRRRARFARAGRAGCAAPRRRCRSRPRRRAPRSPGLLETSRGY